MVSINGIIVIICPLVCGIQEKILMQINLQSRNKRHRKQTYGYQRGKGRGNKLGI